MTKGSKPFNRYDYQEYKRKNPWVRSNDSRVAVNPERITTLLELAIEHYGKKCARCGSKKRLTVHHRHYRTVGFEKPERDIVLLCHECHQDLHKRSKEKRINREDIPYVDPDWAEWLEKIVTPSAKPKRPFYRVVYRDHDGVEWVDIYAGDPWRNLEVEVEYDRSTIGLAEVAEITDITDIIDTYPKDRRGVTTLNLGPNQRDLTEHPRYWRGWPFGDG